MKKFLTGFLATFIIFGTLAATAVSAGPLDKARTKLGTALRPTGLEANLDTQISTVIKGILAMVGTVFLCLTVYAGILWMTAQGNSEKVDKAKGIVTTAVAGLFITMAAYAITAFVTAKVGGVGDAPPQRIGCCQNSNANCYVVSDGICQGGDTFQENMDCDQSTGICR